jgi:hypothetical protein
MAKNTKSNPAGKPLGSRKIICAQRIAPEPDRAQEPDERDGRRCDERQGIENVDIGRMGRLRLNARGEIAGRHADC